MWSTSCDPATQPSTEPSEKSPFLHPLSLALLLLSLDDCINTGKAHNTHAFTHTFKYRFTLVLVLTISHTHTRTLKHCTLWSSWWLRRQFFFLSFTYTVLIVIRCKLKMPSTKQTEGGCTSSRGDVGLELLAGIKQRLGLKLLGLMLELGLALGLRWSLGLAESLLGRSAARASGRLDGELRQLLVVGQGFQHSVLPLQHRVPLIKLLDMLLQDLHLLTHCVHQMAFHQILDGRRGNNVSSGHQHVRTKQRQPVVYNPGSVCEVF